MAELSGPQKNFVLAAWSSAEGNDDSWFNPDEVSTILNIDYQATRDALFAITRQQVLASPSKRLCERSREMIDGYTFNKVGREVARHLVDEQKSDGRKRRADFVKTYIMPVIIAVVAGVTVVYLNNRFYGIEPSISPDLKPSNQPTSQP